MNCKIAKSILIVMLLIGCVFGLPFIDASLVFSVLFIVIPYAYLNLVSQKKVSKVFALVILVLGMFSILPSAISLTAATVRFMKLSFFQYLPCVLLIFFVLTEFLLIIFTIISLSKKEIATSTTNQTMNRMEKVVIFVDVLFVVMYALFFELQVQNIYILVEFLVIVSFLIAEISIILFTQKWYTPFKWLGVILVVSIIIPYLPTALVITSLSHYGYMALLIGLIIVALFRAICSFCIKHGD